MRPVRRFPASVVGVHAAATARQGGAPASDLGAHGEAAADGDAMAVAMKGWDFGMRTYSRAEYRAHAS